jgi:hypothetical protein
MATLTAALSAANNSDEHTNTKALVLVKNLLILLSRQ